MDYILTQHLVKPSGISKKRTSRIIMTNEARVLREMRKAAGLSMRQAGSLLGYTDSYISHIENGRVDIPKGTRLEKFLTIYGGTKQKSFYERVRRYQESVKPIDQLKQIIETLPEDKLRILLQIANSI